MSEPTEGRRAVAAEVLNELAARHRSVKSVYDAIGMGSSTWANYFRRCDRDVPLETFRAVCTELGVPAWEMLRRAEGGVVRPPAATPKAPAAAPAAPDPMGDIERFARALGNGRITLNVYMNGGPE